ncbi:homoserine kinase [Orrella daihaiensis]|uniref:Homoserine kinase n=1 Tax=Orrella daihaiensis TaxID=2782176 RepID=A0ABY4ARG8_9BURK|nr:homoserine kinase [Orrella daihaiensis]UOD51622.1 homoserine kinase [Orrella daihaiensis]
MAVFTPVNDADASELLKAYRLGELTGLEGISAGIENTNYFLDTEQGRYVLTIFEVLGIEQLPFYVELMHHLASRDVPVPMPQTRGDGQRISVLHGKPAIIVSRLPGQWIKQPNANHCALAARTMAQAHLAARDFEIRQTNLRGLDWWQATAPTLTEFLTAKQHELLWQALDEQIQARDNGLFDQLPSGPAHCDYFRDNVLFTGTSQAPSMGGVIDFYFAGCDHWIFDLAVAVNDWCIDRATGELLPDLVNSWMNAYQNVRPLTEQEKLQWPLMLRAAALRFWISRLFDYHRPRPAEQLIPHDPTHFERILTLRMTQAAPPIAEF